MSEQEPGKLRRSVTYIVAPQASRTGHPLNLLSSKGLGSFAASLSPSSAQVRPALCCFAQRQSVARQHSVRQPQLLANWSNVIVHKQSQDKYVKFKKSIHALELRLGGWKRLRSPTGHSTTSNDSTAGNVCVPVSTLPPTPSVDTKGNLGSGPAPCNLDFCEQTANSSRNQLRLLSGVLTSELTRSQLATQNAPRLASRQPPLSDPLTNSTLRPQTQAKFCRKHLWTPCATSEQGLKKRKPQKPQCFVDMAKQIGRLDFALKSPEAADVGPSAAHELKRFLQQLRKKGTGPGQPWNRQLVPNGYSADEVSMDLARRKAEALNIFHRTRSSVYSQFDSIQTLLHSPT